MWGGVEEAKTSKLIQELGAVVACIYIWWHHWEGWKGPVRPRCLESWGVHGTRSRGRIVKCGQSEESGDRPGGGPGIGVCCFELLREEVLMRDAKEAGIQKMLLAVF